MQLHHKDFDKSNYTLDNLELVTQSDHLKIHAGWVRDKNGKWIAKPCKDCGEKLALDKFYQRKGLTPSNRCIKCSSIYFKSKSTDEFKKRRKIYMTDYYNKNKQEKWGIKN